MSDFDDEPTAGSTAPDDQPDGAAAPLDDWDDEVAAAPKAKKSRTKAPADGGDDDWDDDWDDDDSRGNKRDLTLVYAIVAAAIVIVLAVVLTRPKDDNSTENGSANNGNAAAATTADPAPVKNWQGDVADAVGDEGAQAQARAETGPGVYIWTDFQGWHVRNNGTSEVKVAVAAPQVRVKATDDYNDDDEKGDAPFATSGTITLPAGDGKTGQGFDLGGSESATFTVTVNDQNIPADQIKIGGAEGVATTNPVTFTKG